MTPQLAPQRHETEIGDVTVGEREDKVGSVVGVQTDRQGLRRQRDLCPIPPFIQCFDDFWVADLEFADPSQRVADDRALGLQLPVVREVLQLAAAAVVVDVMWTGRGHSPWPRLHDFSQFRACEVAVFLQ